MSARDPLLELRGICAAYGNVDVLFGVDLKVYPGDVVALLGPNGAGKSTLMRVASGRLRATAGQVFLAGSDVTRASPERLAQLGLCTIPEGRGVFPNLSVEDNLRMWAFRRGTRRAEVAEIAYAQFPKLGERRKQLAGSLSGGEQQMLAISRALATNPTLVLFDEISMGLAPIVVEQMFEIVAQLAKSGAAILLAEQFADIALEIATSAAVVTHGRIAFAGTPAQVEARIDDLYFGTPGAVVH